MTKLIRVTPQPNNGDEELIELRRQRHGDDLELWFQFQKVNFYYAPDAGTFGRRIYPINRPLASFTSSKGIDTASSLAETSRLYELNEMVMELPDFRTLFIERATAPFFVFQVFCVGLWCLDEYWYYSIFTLFMLVMFEVLKNNFKNF